LWRLTRGTRAADHATGTMPLFALGTFLAAFLLFQVELVIAKAILPWFGGTPAVWTTCLLFFQVALLGGYAWSHLLVGRSRPRRQSLLHGVLLVACLVILGWHLMGWGSPLLPGASWKPGGQESPVAAIVAMLGVAVGLPFFALAATTPLLQAWFSRSWPGRSPYRLYALSNLGSLLALLSYPFVVEPLLSLRVQARVWGIGFVLFALAGLACAVVAGWGVTGRELQSGPREGQDVAPGRPGPGVARRLLWLGLPASASVLLLAVTNQISQEVAVIPFLWVLPLSLYLLSFVISFHDRRWYSRTVFVPLLGVAVFGACVLLYHGVDVPVLLQIGSWSFVLFVCCMVCHGELARLAPDPRHLTSYYLLLAAGGALGGVFVALVAPVLFDGFWELHAGLVACGLLALLAWLEDRDSWLRSGPLWVPAAALLGALAGAAYLLLPGLEGHALHQLWPRVAVVAAIVAALLVLARRRRGSRLWGLRPLFATGCVAVALTLLSVVLRAHIAAVLAGSLEVSRGFFGVLKVEEEHAGDPDRHVYLLRHGRIVHGFQFVSEAKRRLATSYYGEGSGIAIALLHHPKRERAAPEERALRIGVAGLGVGTIAAYGEPGDVLRFYEINPDVIRFATMGMFTYLEDTPARVQIVQGDARVSLEREPNQHFDVLAIDAFSSGAIPVHLLTAEAFAVYLRHLQPDGVLAIDVSNRTLDLTPVVWGLARHFGLAGVQVARKASTDGASWGSLWILLTRDVAFLGEPGVADERAPHESRVAELPFWTDDHSSLLPLLKTSAWDPEALAARGGDGSR
jgi:SAM-dependent methyltransferase